MKVKFSYQEWLNDRNKKVVNEEGEKVPFYEMGDRHIVLVHGKAYNPDDAPIYFEVYGPSDETAKNTKVSDFAKSFHKNSTTYEKALVVECANWFIELSGIFGHYDFFTKELWRKVDGFKRADKAEVIAAFLHWWFRYRYGFQGYTCGSAWTNSHPSSYIKDDECYETYIKEWMPLYKAYQEWCNNQQ